VTGPAWDTQRRGAKAGSRISRFTLVDYFLALLAGLLAFAVYFRTLAPGLLFGDSAEFQMAAWLGSIVHPTGYPLYLILGNLWTHLLRAGDPAWRMNLLSAVWGGLAVALVYLLVLRVIALAARGRARHGGRAAPEVPADSSPAAGRSTAARLAALFAALALAVTPTFWSQAIIAEVYTLNAVFVAAVLLGLTTWAAPPAQPYDPGGAVSQPRRYSNVPFYLTAAIYGLSLAHHRSMLLLIPAIAVFLWLERSRWESRRAALRGLAWGLGLVLLPLLLYLYIPLRGPVSPYASVRIGPDQTLRLYLPTLSWFIGHVSGEVFGSALGASTGLAARLASAARLFVSELSWIGLGLGTVGLIWLSRRSLPLLALTGLAFMAVVVFNLSYRIGDIFVFYIPAYLIWILWAALGVVAVATLLSRAAAPRGQRAQAILLLVPCALALAVPAWSLVEHYGALDRSADNQARATWQAILAQPIPSDAILVSNDRDEMVPLWYLQYVEGIRTDVTGLFPLIQPGNDWADVGQVILTASRSQRPLLLIKPMPGLETRFRIEPVGGLERVAGPAVNPETPPSNPREVDFGGAIRLTGYDLAPDPLSGGKAATVTLYWQPLHPLGADYSTFVHLVNADGDVIGGSDHLPGGVYYPSTLWKPGDLLRDAHAFTLTADLGPPPYAIEAGLYTGGPVLQHLGQPEIIGQVESTASETASGGD
jgi:hypothetical protein